MAKPRNKIIDRLVYLALRLFDSLVHMFDVHTNYRTARWIGDAIYFLDRKHRRIAIEHLRRSFPDWSDDRCRQVARESMRSLIYLGLEFLFTTRLITLRRWRRHIHLGEVAEGLRLLTEQDRPVLFVTGHFGNWEILGYTVAVLGYPVSAIARRLDNPLINAFALDVREKAGLRIIDKRGATGPVRETLDTNGAVGFIADQDAGRKGMFVDFFGRPASTYKIIGLLAMEYRCPIVVGSVIRLGERFEFELSTERTITPDQWADRDDPLRWITQEYTHALEAMIRRHPEQYLWVHRRWKHRPKGEQPSPDGIA